MSIRWTEEELEAYEWRKKKAKARSKGRDKPAVPELESSVRRGLDSKEDKQTQNEGAYEICVISYASRATDPDNICPKAFIDVLVKKGYLPDDSSKYVRGITKRVVKCKKAEQRTVIEIWKEIKDES